MKESKDKEHRISNLKELIQNVSEEPDELEEEFEEDSELIDYLKGNQNDDSQFEIDDEFIYRPGEHNENPINLEENPIDEDFIINTPVDKESDENNENTVIEDFPDDFMGDVSENFDNLINAKIGRTPVMGIVSAFLGLILIVISAFIFQSRSDRIIDHVASGETNFIFLIVLIFGLLFLVYGIMKVFHISMPFKNITDSIDSISKDEQKADDDKKEETPQAIPKSNIPLDKDSYKIGEFNMDDLKNKLKKPPISQPKKQPTQEELDAIPPAREKEESKKGLTSEEIEEIEYEEVVLENESIDDIFAEVEDIDDIPIISIDSEEKDK